MLHLTSDFIISLSLLPDDLTEEEEGLDGEWTENTTSLVGGGNNKVHTLISIHDRMFSLVFMFIFLALIGGNKGEMKHQFIMIIVNCYCTIFVRA